VAAGLAAQGLNLVLVSRSKAKLDAAAQDIQQQWPETKVRFVFAATASCKLLVIFPSSNCGATC
jgi:NADP-dependent 3-hydroxy acid dehydrogenase YdfG